MLVRRFYPGSRRRDVTDVSRLDVLVCLAHDARQRPNIFQIFRHSFKLCLADHQNGISSSIISFSITGGGRT